MNLFIILLTSNWQLSFGLKTRSDINNNSGYQGEYHIDDGSQNITDGSIYLDNDEYDIGIPDEEAFLYTVVFNDFMALGYSVFPTYAIKADGTEIQGIVYTDFFGVYEDTDKDNDELEIGSGFVALLNQPEISEDDVDQGIDIIELVDKDTPSRYDENWNFFLTFQEEIEPMHYVAFEKYVIYSINNFRINYESYEDKFENYDLDLGLVYNFDLTRPVYDPDLGKPFNPPGYSLNQLVDYGLVEDALKAFMNEQTQNGMSVDSVSTVYISMEAFNDFQANNQEESFLGLSPEEIYYIQANIPSSLFYHVDSDGVTQVLELPPDPADKATVWERIAAALVSITVAVVAIVIATTLMVTTAGTMSVAGAMLIGAAIGFGVEFFTQVTINGTPLEKVDWAKVAVSTIAGALSAIPGIGWWGAGLVMGGSQAAMSWIDGNDFKDVLLAFGIGFATGVVIHFATKALGSLTNKMMNKFIV